MTNDNDNKIEAHYGDKVITVADRFDRVDKQLLLVLKAIVVLAAGELILIGVNLPEVGPLIVALSKMI